MRNRIYPGSLLLLALLIALSGCSTIEKQFDQPPHLPDSSQDKRPTHYFEVLDELGPPARLTSMPGGFAFLYETLKINERQFGISSDVAILRWFKLSYGSASASQGAYVYVFNNDGYLQSYGNRFLKENVGKGLSFQFIVKVTPIVDTSHLEQSPGQHTWGASLLKPLPITLNSSHGMDAGLYGLELRGTPTSAGQRTLEMRTTRKGSKRRTD